MRLIRSMPFVRADLRGAPGEAGSPMADEATEAGLPPGLTLHAEGALALRGTPALEQTKTGCAERWLQFEASVVSSRRNAEYVSRSPAGMGAANSGLTSRRTTPSLARTRSKASLAARALPSTNGWKKQTSR